MAKTYYSRKNIDYLLYDVHRVDALTELPHYADHSKETFDMTIDAAAQIGDNFMFPYFTDMDRNQPELINGEVTVHPKIKAYLKAAGEAGLIGADFSYADGGVQIPSTIQGMVGHIFMAANNGMAYTGLTAGAARLIAAFGTAKLKQTYVEKMLNGQYQGTMCLTEPQAGSSLSDITTTAIRTGDGNFKLKGQKIFISAGDHPACDNIVHLLIGRIEGAPLGTKGISLFVVPKYLEDGTRNDISNMGIYHKLGQRAVPAMHLGFGDKDNCVAYLVGEENKGLSYMFQMMNEARIGVGLTGASIATGAYHAALEYAKERPQSRRLHKKSALDNPQIPIIEHPDVRRMLLFQKAVVEGSLSLLTEVSIYADKAHAIEDSEEKDRYFKLLELLTPVAKTYPCEAGVQACSSAVQVFGGYGFTEDFPVEQYYRDIRITPIYEGTTGIQSLDLLGRKVLMEKGAAIKLLYNEIFATVTEATSVEGLANYAGELKTELADLQMVTTHLAKVAQGGDVELFLSDANLYMEQFSLVTIAWQWLKMGVAAKRKLLATSGENSDEINFLESKIQTMKYFFHYELPKTMALSKRLMDAEEITILREKDVALV